MPDDILGDDYEIIKTTLEGYQRVRESLGWDKYAEKLSLTTREMMAVKFQECKDNGFYGPHIFNNKIVFSQLVRR